MVKQAAWTFGIALVGMGVSACPARADNILEQIQNEVATVAGKARSCIVSIEDARAIVVSYNNSALEKADLENQLEHARIDRAAAAAKAAQEEQRYRAGLITALGNGKNPPGTGATGYAPDIFYSRKSPTSDTKVMAAQRAARSGRPYR